MCCAVLTEGERAGSERPPTVAEMKACRPRLWESVYAVDPLIILCFGATATTALFGKPQGSAVRDGQLTSLMYVDIPGVDSPTVRYSVLPAPSIPGAERTGDYGYEKGQVESLIRSIKTAWDIASKVRGEDSL